MKHLPILLLALACGPALAQDRPRAAPITAEESSARLAEIERQRSSTQAELAQAEAGCYRKFAVNDCLTDARAEFRPRISALRKQEVSVRDGDRARKEEERLARLEEQRQTALRSEESARQRAADDRDTDAAQKKQERDAAAPGNAARAASQRAETERRLSEDAAQRAQREAEAPAARQRAEARQQEAEERRAALRRREAERQGKPLAAPLPANP